MPDISRTEIGRRMFSLQKDKNVEQVIEKIRKHLGPDWALFSQNDLGILKYIIGEVWVYREREFWEKVTYSRITVTVLVEIISTGRKLLAHEIHSQQAVEEVSALLLRSEGQVR